MASDGDRRGGHQATEEELSLAKSTAYALELLQGQLEAIKPLLKFPNGNPRPTWTEELRRTTREITHLGKEMRQQAKSTAAKLSNMGIEEKLQVVYVWFEELSPQKQREALQQLARIHNGEKYGVG